MFAFLLAATLGLCRCSRDNSTDIVLALPTLSGPSEALVETSITLECALPVYPWNQTVLLQLFKEGNHDKVLGEYSVLDGNAASIPIFIRPNHEGNLECVARAQGNPSVTPTVSGVHYLRVIEPVRGAEVNIVTDGDEFFEEAELELLCSVSAGSHVSYTWLLNGRPVPHRDPRDDTLFIARTSPEDSGSYTCVATNVFNQTQVFSSNSSVAIRVKEVVSNPSISYEVVKEASDIFWAAVTCRCSRGTPPIAVSLYRGTELVTSVTSEDGEATFRVPVTPGVPVSWLQCQANNSERTAHSRRMSVEVVPVGGPVEISYDYDVGENYAVIGVRLYCKAAAAGSHPQYRWFLNTTLLHGRGSFFYVVDRPPEQSILLLSVGSSSAGTYRCEVQDRFDNSSTISSRRLFMSKEVLNRLPVLVVAVVVGSASVLVLMLSVCCWAGITFRRRLSGITPAVELKMSRRLSACEDEPDCSDFAEDWDVVNAAREAEIDV